MRITFWRFPAGVDSYSEIERDDGAVFRMAEFRRVGTGFPHDLRHLIVEMELASPTGSGAPSPTAGYTTACA